MWNVENYLFLLIHFCHMAYSVEYWRNLYQQFKDNALCLDIETTEYNGTISMIGLYKPQDGMIEYSSLIRNENLDRSNLQQAVSGCKLLITYNGHSFDLPKIKAEFPNALPNNIPNLDLYLFAKRLNIGTGLKVLENTFGVWRPNDAEKKGMAIKLWKRYTHYRDDSALSRLIEYNKQDVINLYPLAEELMRLSLQIQEQAHSF